MSKTLNEVLSNGRENNFNAIRLLMALGVLYNHSFKLFNNNGRQDVVNYLFGFFDAGSLSVAVFFLISGMLLTQSFFNTQSRIKFILKRIMRIFPGLLVCLLFTVFIVGTINTTFPLQQYFSDRAVYRYFYNIFLSNEVFAYNLPGVFTTNKCPLVVNGSLWTLPFELLCYIFLFIILSVAFFSISKKHGVLKKVLFFLLVIYFSAYLLNGVYIISRIKELVTGFSTDLVADNNPVFLFFFFGTGMLFYLFRNYIRLNYFYFLCISILLALAHNFHLSFLQRFLESATIAYGTIVLAGAKWLHPANFKLDPSYGIYLYAWPVQQTFAHYFNLGSYESMLYTIPTSVLLGCLSYKFIEGPALATVGPFYKRLIKENELVMA